MAMRRMYCDAAKNFQWEEEEKEEDMGYQKQIVNEQPSMPLPGAAVSFENADVKIFEHGLSGSLFQTGSGKMVTISSAGLNRAKRLLGIDDGNDPFDFQADCQRIDQQSFTNDCHGQWQNSSFGSADARPFSMSFSEFVNANFEKKFDAEVNSNLMEYGTATTASYLPQIKFHTAGGKSISVSSYALKRARRLLGEVDSDTILDEVNADSPAISGSNGERFGNGLSNKENDFYTPSPHQDTAKTKTVPNVFTSPLGSSSRRPRSLVNSAHLVSGNNLMNKFDAVDNENLHLFNGYTSSSQKQQSSLRPHFDKSMQNTENGFGSRKAGAGRSLDEPLVDITNRITSDLANCEKVGPQKRRFGLSSVSQFKRPRCSIISAPLNQNISHVPNDSTRYPLQGNRMPLEAFFGVLPTAKKMLEHVTDEVKCMTAHNADKYVFCDESGSLGVEDFLHMLVKCGASVQHASKELVKNHYKWIVWKLACYDRCYPAKSAGNFLTVSNVLAELKYRYEREAKHGHRSTIKRILEGNASPSSAMVLCVSAIHSNHKSIFDVCPSAAIGTETVDNVKVELTDGWYAINASLDVLLAKQLATGKLFVGQKLRIWGAALCGWIGPITPFEALGSVSLQLNINGTYRVHWAEKLGFCRNLPPTLAFRCIKSNGGPVPRTLVGITRIYPVLYKEKLNTGAIVRSERMETRSLEIYNQRRSSVVKSIVSNQEDLVSYIPIDDDSEVAKIFKELETDEEAIFLMADMSEEQLKSIARYREKIEEIRQYEMEKSIQKALEDAGLSERQVTSFMRVRVVGLTSKHCHNKGGSREGIITVWQPSDKLPSQLVEGQAYTVSGLVPVNADSETLFLHARKSTNKWHSLTPQAMTQFRPFFNPRKSVLLSNLGEVPISSEFDTAAFVLHVGDVYTVAHQRKQWLFVTDGSIPKFQYGELRNSLLAICFCSPYIEDDSFEPLNSNLTGSTLGFSNLINRPKDQRTNMWIAEATENSMYYSSFSTPQSSHLRGAANAAQRWASNSAMTIAKLKKKAACL